MVELTNVHISEFIRVICILCLVESDVAHCSSLTGELDYLSFIGFQLYPHYPHFILLCVQVQDMGS